MKKNKVFDIHNFSKNLSSGFKRKQTRKLFLIISIVSFVLSSIITLAFTIGGSSETTINFRWLIEEFPVAFIPVLLMIFLLVFLIICWIEDMILFGIRSLGFCALACCVLFFCALSYVAIPVLILACPFEIIARFQSFSQTDFDITTKEGK